MTRVTTSPELAYLRSDGQAADLFCVFRVPPVVYTALLNGVPTSDDMVAEINYDGAVGTLANVKPDMKMTVYSADNTRRLGYCRIRKSPTSSKFYIGEQSKIVWEDNAILKVLDDYDLFAKHIKMNGSTPRMDYDIDYSDQHVNFLPVPVLGPNRIKKKTGSTVTVQLGPEIGTVSWVEGSSISTYLWSIPDATAISSTSAVRPTATFNSVGWHTVYCTVTAANGKSKQGVRYVYIYDKDHMPMTVFKLSSMDEEFLQGGFTLGVEVYADSTQESIPDNALFILFSEDYYGVGDDQTQVNIGPIVDAENILAVGRIVSESVSYNALAGKATFNVAGYQEFFKQIAAFPHGLQMKNTATAWTDMPALTVKRGLIDFLEQRSTATRMMDVIITTDDLYAKELASPASNLWAQMTEFTFATQLANIKVDSYGRFFCEQEPLLMPEDERTYPKVQEITGQDLVGNVDAERNTMSKIGLLDLSGVNVNLGGTGVAFFSGSPGHVFDHYGGVEIVDRLLLASQAKANQKAGLLFAVRNNEYPSLKLKMRSSNHLLSCFPNQAITYTVPAALNPRGIEFTANWIPRRRKLSYDGALGVLTTEMEFDCETAEVISQNGDVPGSGDFSFPPLTAFPKVPPSPIILPSTSNPTTVSGPPKVLIHDVGVQQKGLLYTENFNTLAPDWRPVNDGLTTLQFQTVRKIQPLLSGAAYISEMFHPTPGNSFLAYTSRVGLPWTVLLDQAAMIALFGVVDFGIGLATLATNPLTSEFAFTLLRAGDNVKWYQGTGSAFTLKSSFTFNLGSQFGDASYGLGKWLLTNGFWMTLSPAGVPTGGSGLVGTNVSRHIRAGTTGKTYHYPAGDDLLVIGADNCASVVGGVGGTALGLGNEEELMATDPTGQFIMTRSSTGTPIRSPDFGTTWISMAGAPPTGIPPLVIHKYFCINANEWIAVAGSAYYTRDFGVHWEERRGNLATICPLLECNSVKVIGL